MTDDGARMTTADGQLVELAKSVLARDGPEMDMTALGSKVYEVDPNARATMKAAGGAKKWLEGRSHVFELFRPRPVDQPLVWWLRLAANPRLDKLHGDARPASTSHAAAVPPVADLEAAARTLRKLLASGPMQPQKLGEMLYREHGEDIRVAVRTAR